jgi:hypothetical protein
MAMVLSATMVVGMMPVSALAETSAFPIGTSGEITAFEALGPDVAMRSVPLGTFERDLELPDTLTATIRLAALEEEPVLDSGETDAELDSTDTGSGSAIGIYEIDDIEYGEEAEIASPSDVGEDGDRFDAEPTEKTVDNTDEITVFLPVIWASSPEYDGEAVGTYVFTPELPEGLTLASGVEVPAIAVTVGAAAITGTVTAFDVLPDEIRWQNTTAPDFPETLGGIVEGEMVQIPVTWEADHDYDAEYPQRGLYVFTAIMGEGYGIEDGVEFPRITVYIPQTVGRMMARMAGGGTTDSPLEITTATQLAEIATLVNTRSNGLELFLFNDAEARVTLELQNDIDLSAYSKGEGWTPIGTSICPFGGVFDGGGKIITGLYISRSADFQGLFGCIRSGGTVRNVGVAQADIASDRYVGGVAGYSNGMVENCYSTGTISGELSVGGVIGHLYHGTVQNCYSTGTVSGNANVGGVVGTATFEGTLINCYSTGDVSGTQNVGGVAGEVSISVMVQNCAALNPSISGKIGLGRVAGNCDSSSNLSGNIAFAGTAVTQDGSAKTLVTGAEQVDGESKTASDIMATDFFASLFGNGTAWIYAVGRLPVLDGFSGQSDALPAYLTWLWIAGAGTSEDPCRIYTAADLKYLADMVNSDNDFTFGIHFRLENDIDLSAYGEDYDGGKGWAPIQAFINAVFDGNGKKVTGLYINRSNETNIGLFDQVTASTIQNLFLEGISLHGDTDYSDGKIGGLAGQVSGGSTISGCAARGSVAGDGTSISYCAGGLIGLLEQGSTLNNCAFYGTVSAKAKEVSEPATSPPNIFAGGIVGRLHQSAAITNCVSVANVSSAGESAYSGGIAGQVDAGAKIALSAALGAGVAGTIAGRIAGIITSTASGDPNNKNSAWSGMDVNGSKVSGDANSLNGEDADAAAIQTLWASGALKGWDTDIWTLAEGKLPVLKELSNQNDALPAYIAGLLGVGGSADNPFEIYDAVALDFIAQNMKMDSISNSYFKLMADIDLSHYPNWTPIGDPGNPFMGTFDGDGHRITNVNINRYESFQGLFGLVRGTVKNLGVVEARIHGKDSTGGVVGYLDGGTVQNCYVTGEVGGIYYVGGVVGYLGDGTVQYCYATGNVSGTSSVGGVVGSSSSGTVKNCVALNPDVSGASSVGRVAGNASSTLLSNYAFSRTPGTWANKGPGAKDGADVTSQTLFSANFWTAAGNWYAKAWDSSIWTFGNDKLPALKGLVGQGGEGSLHLTARNIQYATVTPNTISFTYNGSQQLPTLTITFDGETLEKDINYTVSITSMDGSGTSAGTNAGTVTLTITGIGNFYGTKNLTYTIGKKAVTITPAEGQSKNYGATDPVLTYTASPILSGSDVFIGSLSRASGENAGSYAITLGDLIAGGNYELFLASGTVNFTIEKRQITLTADHKSVIKGSSLPELTYTVVNLAPGKTKADALSIEPVLTCPTFDGNTPGSYVITLTGGTATDNYTITTRTNATLTVAEQTYIVTFNLNGGSRTGGGELTQTVAEGGAAMAPTVSRSGYTFTGWDKAFDNVTSDLTVTASWRYDGGGGGGSSSDSSPVIVTPPAADKPNFPTQGEIKVPGTADSKGNITVNITDKTVTDAFEKALAEAKKNGNEQNGITLILHVDIGSKTGSNIIVNLPKAVLDTIIAKKIVNIVILVDSHDIKIGMDLAAVQEINKQAKSDVNITATRMDSGKLTGDAKKAIGSRPAFDLKLNYGSGKQVQSFGSGSVSVTIPYTLGANEKAGNVQAVYVDGKSKVHWLVNSVYDSVEKVLRFSTNHFSAYGIGYKQANTAFTDIAGHWAKEDIEFVVSRGLLNGTSDTAFGANTAMTKGMFVTALGRLANADVSSYTKSSFTDVKSYDYYMGYIEWASKNSIVSGNGSGKFAPDQSITREQMAVIMQNYAKAIGFTLLKVHVENTFADSAKISAYAKDSVKQMQMAGVISGKNGNLFDPQGTATRAEVSAVLRRFVELAVSSDTMQGWTRNDSGQWMYYENSKPVTGKKDIGGTTYTFDQYGVTADVPKNLKYATYSVQKGDSFWLIARKLGCTMAELERLNNKSRFALIHPGDVLRVPEK